ncbi:MAG: hypothetical protein E7304_04140 [Butyrivibrio sp.]|jgi:hypothetical protein|uniref:hypothetical protein n=1 Tax=Butyrivibrio sp. TaxID=28121 RepID=UPI001ED78D44|nr:hypothetical protein [Butyrivibrio sp.]MBE5840581.1 hypothetical protein [Butyrivibrio sp.]
MLWDECSRFLQHTTTPRHAFLAIFLFWHANFRQFHDFQHAFLSSFQVFSMLPFPFSRVFGMPFLYFLHFLHVSDLLLHTAGNNLNHFLDSHKVWPMGSILQVKWPFVAKQAIVSRF